MKSFPWDMSRGTLGGEGSFGLLTGSQFPQLQPSRFVFTPVIVLFEPEPPLVSGDNYVTPSGP